MKSTPKPTSLNKKDIPIDTPTQKPFPSSQKWQNINQFRPQQDFRQSFNTVARKGLGNRGK